MQAAYIETQPVPVLHQRAFTGDRHRLARKENRAVDGISFLHFQTGKNPVGVCQIPLLNHLQQPGSLICHQYKLPAHKKHCRQSCPSDPLHPGTQGRTQPISKHKRNYHKQSIGKTIQGIVGECIGLRYSQCCSAGGQQEQNDAAQQPIGNCFSLCRTHPLFADPCCQQSNRHQAHQAQNRPSQQLPEQVCGIEQLIQKKCAANPDRSLLLPAGFPPGRGFPCLQIRRSRLPQFPARQAPALR